MELGFGQVRRQVQVKRGVPDACLLDQSVDAMRNI